MRLFTSTFDNFSKIPGNIICIGITNNFPEYLRTTTISNFLYTPNSILAPEYEITGMTTNSYFAEEYVQKINDGIKDLGFYSIHQYFSEMITSFENNYQGICFLSSQDSDVFSHRTVFRELLKSIGYQIQEYDPDTNNKIINEFSEVKTKDKVKTMALF